jgi:hypothetical protein
VAIGERRASGKGSAAQKISESNVALEALVVHGLATSSITVRRRDRLSYSKQE